MREQQVKNATGNRCIACRGTWVPIAGLASMLPAGKTKKRVEGDFDRAFANGDRNYGSLCCPTCEGTPLVVAEVRGVEIDICESCYGVFFDAGEVGRVTIRREVEPRRSATGSAGSAGDVGAWGLDIVGMILAFLSDSSA